MTDLVLRPRGTYSQAQQDTILARIFSTMAPINKVCVEFGFNSTDLTGGSGSNAARLILEEGWSGTFFDQTYENPAIHLYREHLTPDNIAAVFARYKIPRDLDYLSIDVDSIDLWLWRALLETDYRPSVVSVEYNSNYGLTESVTARPDTVNRNDQCYGASLAALYRLGMAFEYALVDVEPGLDLFFVQADRWPGPVLTLEDCAAYVNLAVHPVPSAERKAAVMMAYV